MTYSRNGIILYSGPSAIDGAPIVCVATGISGRSDNAKTGAMIQTWILRADMHPSDAIRTGADASICGSCTHRGDAATGRTRTCYVTIVQAPRAVYAAYAAGRYRAPSRADALAILKATGRPIRLGAYGDPAALPTDLVADLAHLHPRHTGYTHQWRTFRHLRPYLMASADSLQEATEARAAGWRTFRTGADAHIPAPHEITCPASAEAHYRTSCERCGLCNGATSDVDGRASIRILPHGSAAVAFYRTAPAPIH